MRLPSWGGPERPPVNRGRLQALVLGAMAAVAAYALVGFLLVPALVQRHGLPAASEALGRRVTVDNVVFNPFTLTARLEGVQILDAAGRSPALTARLALADLEWRSLWVRGPVLAAVRLEAPQLRIVRQADGRYDFSDLLQRPAPADPDPASEPLRFALHNLELTEGRVDFEDRPRGRRHVVSDLALGIPAISNLPSQVEIHVQPKLEARLNGAPLNLDARARPFFEARDGTVHLQFQDLDLAGLDTYSPVPLTAALQRGRLSAQLALGFRRPGETDGQLEIQGQAQLNGVEVMQRGAPLLNLVQLAVDVKSLKVFSRQAHLSSIAVKSPDLALRRDPQGQLNLAGLVSPSLQANSKSPVAAPATAASAPANSPSAPTAPGWAVAVDRITLDGGTLSFTDTAVAGGFQTRWTDLALQVTGLDTAPGRSTSADLSARGPAGESLQVTTRAELAEAALEAHLSLQNLNLPALMPYLAPHLSVRLSAGRIGAAARVVVAGARQAHAWRLTDGVLTLDDLAVHKAGEKAPWIALKAGRLESVAVDPAARTVTTGPARLTQPAALLVRDRRGEWNLAQLGAPAPGPAPATRAQRAPAVQGQPTPAWNVALASLSVTDGRLRFDDQAVGARQPLDLSGIRLTAAPLGTTRGLSSAVDASVNAGAGSLQAQGRLSLSPLKADLKLLARQLDLRPARPYYADRLHAQIRRGTLSARGQLQLAQDPGLQVHWTGQASVDQLYALDTLDDSDLLKWGALTASDMDVAVDTAAPSPLTRLKIGTLALKDYFAKIILSRQGTLNLAQLTRTDSAPPSAASGTGATPPRSPLPVSVGRIVLERGQVNYTDLFIQPNYVADLTRLSGSISGLTSATGTAGDVKLQGTVNGDAPVEITGRVNPLSAQLYLDLKASARGIDLPSFTPYSGKYVGYGIDKGKLSVDVAYQVEQGQLKASNQIVLDQLVFGQHIDSQDAIQAPVLLAVALLRDSRGVIDIRLPISGSIDDPQFSVGRILLKALANLIVKAATAPFQVLAAAFGGGEDLGHLAFAPGASHIGPDQADKLKVLAKALNERPGLRLEITGRTDATTDASGLRRAALERRVRVAKSEATGQALEDVRVDPTEYPALLERLYREAPFRKEKTLGLLTRRQPVAVMEQLLLDHIEVGDTELRQLGLARAQAIQTHLAEVGQVSRDRLFLVAPGTGGGASPTPPEASWPTTRADFTLK